VALDDEVMHHHALLVELNTIALAQYLSLIILPVQEPLHQRLPGYPIRKQHQDAHQL